jgi:hypothetical protein
MPDFSLLKIHKTAFEIRPAKEVIPIDDLQTIAESEEYGKDAKRKLRWMKYIDAYDPIKNYIEVPYKANKKNLGRLEAELSMCDEEGNIRAAICGDLYYDIDGVNMGYQIFYQTYTILTVNDPKASKLLIIKDFI